MTMQQLKPNVTSPSISDIYQQINEGRLVLQPEFQRKFVWTHEHQESFIDTILKGLPFPEVYVCHGEVDISNMRTIKHVIDGQQRLTTIKNYIENGFDRPLSSVSSYQSLTDTQKKSFLSYEIVMRDLGEVDEATVREVFKRINLTKFKLDDVEIQNAVYDGHFIQAAKKILDNVSLEEYGVLRESEFTRMADLHFILTVMATLENNGYFSQDNEVEMKISSFNEEYPNKNNIVNLLIDTFKRISELDLPVDSMWFRKSNFFTLVVETAKHLKEIPDSFREKLLALEENVMSNRKDSSSPFHVYYSYMYQGTQNRKARVVRGDFFKEYCL